LWAASKGETSNMGIRQGWITPYHTNENSVLRNSTCDGYSTMISEKELGHEISTLKGGMTVGISCS
jgi:hypothetical protein